MKTRYLPALLSAIVLLSAAARLGAQNQTRYSEVDRQESQREIGRRQWFMDNAAKIYRGDVERKQALLTSIKASTFDFNHDGKLDATERAAWERRLRIVLSKTPEWMRQYDTDHDNILSDAEWEAAYHAIFEPSGTSGGA